MKTRTCAWFHIIFIFSLSPISLQFNMGFCGYICFSLHLFGFLIMSNLHMPSSIIYIILLIFNCSPKSLSSTLLAKTWELKKKKKKGIQHLRFVGIFQKLDNSFFLLLIGVYSGFKAEKKALKEHRYLRNNSCFR